MVRQLINEKYISEIKHENIQTLRLLKKGQQIIKDETDIKVTGNIKKLNRIHRIAECWLMMRRAGIEVMSDEGSCIMNKSPPSFKTSLDIKTDADIRKNINSSRMAGVMTNNCQSYIVYNCDDDLIRWSDIKESETECFMSRYYKITGSIIFGRTTDTALKILKSTGGKKISVIKADTNFKHPYFVPLSEDGVAMLKIMSHPNWEETTVRAILTDQEISRRLRNVDCDGTSDNGLPIMIACSLDLTRLKRLRTSADLGVVPGVELYCFPWQSKLLYDYFSENKNLKVCIYEVEIN